MLRQIRYLFLHIKIAMNPEASSIEPPLAVRGMTVLNRNAFRKKVVLPSIAVQNKFMKNCIKKVKSKMVRLLNNRQVVEPSFQISAKLDQSEYKLILLQPGTTMDLLKEECSLNPRELCSSEEIHYHECYIGYENFRTGQILKAVIPTEEVLSSYTQTGHIAHVNLREHLLPYKGLIGQVLLDKIPTAKTVVNKPQIIENEFRNFELELIAGEEDYIVTTVEYGLKFKFDFSKVFWNSRLSTEHRRLVDVIEKDDVVFDVCAGVGPFAVPAAKKGCHVFANDLNPESYKWLVHNAKLNKTELKAFCMDGREFLVKELKAFLLENQNPKLQVHVIMNLPAIAVEFLDAFNGMLDKSIGKSNESIANNDVRKEWQKRQDILPNINIHCHSFAPAEGGSDELKKRTCQHLGCQLPQDATFHFVRKVSPNKLMFCVSFVLPKAVLFEKTSREVDSTFADEPPKKRLKP